MLLRGDGAVFPHKDTAILITTDVEALVDTALSAAVA